MKKFVVETYYTCTFKTLHKLNDLNEQELSKIDSRSDGEVEVMVGSSNTPEGATSWSSPVTFDPETENKVDCLVSGKYLALRIQSKSNV